MRLHVSYIDKITNPKTPPPKASKWSKAAEEEQDWYVARLDRTRWFDLLSVQDRIEAFEALWKVMASVTASPEDGTGSEAQEYEGEREMKT